MDEVLLGYQQALTLQLLAGSRVLCSAVDTAAAP